MRWLELPVQTAIQFPPFTGAVSVLGEEKGRSVLEQWNASQAGRFVD